MPYPPKPAPSPASKQETEPTALGVPLPPSPTIAAPKRPPAAPVLGPRQAAARNLTREAVGFLGQGEVTAAIDALEQSLSLDARSGETYYYLAEAWHKKGNPGQARQFHRLSRTYLEDQAGWSFKLQRQAERLGL